MVDMTTNEITAALSPRDSLLRDLFTTALEGGIDYWAEVVAYDGAEGRDFTATIVEDDSGEEFRIDRKVIARGFRLATGEMRSKVSWSCGKPPVVVKDPQAWDYDATDADVVLQLGLFGAIRYA